MSQQHDETAGKEMESGGMQADDFDAGFELSSDDNPDAEKNPEPAAQPAASPADDAAADAGAEEAAGQKRDEPAPFDERVPPADPPQQEEPPKKVEINDDIKDEFERLQKLSPQAAALAVEDSPEGAAVRRRLEQVGAESAEDKAAFIMMQRDRKAREAAGEQQAVKEHNNRFMSTLQREVPEYFNLLTDTKRTAEAQAYFKEVYDWIASKPYAEAAPLMEIARSGRDPVQVAELIKGFESERKARPTARQADPTAALAVPSRGAPPAPAGIGDKDDFDAGFDLATASKK